MKTPVTCCGGPLAADAGMLETWQDFVLTFFGAKVTDLWVWFDSLTRQEWLIVMASCCAVGFLLLKSWGKRGPC